MDDFTIWDAHVHLFPDRLFRAIWGWFEKFSISMPYTGLSRKEITVHLAGMGVEKAFLLVYAHKAGISLEINRWLYRFCRENPMYLPFGCVHPGDPNLELVIGEALDRYGFYGFKIQYQVLEMRADDPAFNPVYRALESRGRALVAHASTAPIPGPWLGMDKIEPVLAAYPGMTVQVAHLGHFEVGRAATLLRKYPNLYLDTAWGLGNSTMEVNLDEIRDLILEFPDRVVYGSDFPIIMEDPRLTVEKIKQLSLPGPVTRGVLSDNAKGMVDRISGKSP